MLLEAVVFFQDGAEAIVWERGYFVIFDAGHRFGGDHGVDYSFFGGLDRGGEDEFNQIVWQHF